MASKYGYLMLPGVFPDKLTPNIGFTGQVVVQCKLLIVKILL